MENSLAEETETVQKTGTQIKVYKYRWIVLGLYVLVCMISFLQTLEFSIIANIIIKYYKVGEFLVDLTCVIFFIAYIIFFYPISYLIEKNTLKHSMICAMILTLLGNLLKLLAANQDRFWIILLAQTLIAIGQVYICSVPTKIATSWFGSEEVSTACAIGVLGIQLGSGISCIQSPYLVKDGPNTETQLFHMFLYQAIATIVTFVLVILFFRSKPALPPSQSQLNLMIKNEMATLTFFEDMKEVIRNKNFWLVVFSLGFANGLWSVFGVQLNMVYIHYFPNGEHDSGILGLLSIFSGGCLASMLFGIVLDKTHRFKLISVFILIFSAISYLCVVVSLMLESRIGSYISITAFGFFVAPVLIVGFEYLVEITYPIPEACSSSLFNTSYYVLAVIFTYVMEGLYSSIGYFWTFVVTCILYVVCAIFIMFVKTDLKRRDANLQHSLDKKELEARGVNL
ncbi:uncharacterized MFS-type transporter C09D4.1-like [Sitophilus oryzae]|uniref:Uncharacterized MFS-type transporter C09D4.1-like n=1 Tax=Sitophilus oryzae TaxID=7048 RepID=A0A6J2YZL8_SITOR|nr:uncharacterized MFS-type transporter C09D4.1-like [Sitophilus oryzae]